MGRFYTGSIANESTEIFFTSDGTETGRPRKVEVVGDDAFADDEAIAVNYSADNTPWYQAVEIAKKGIQFEFKFLVCTETVKEALEEMIKPTRSTSATVRVKLNSPKRNIDVQAKAAPHWTSTGKFSGSEIEDVVFRFISTGPGA